MTVAVVVLAGCASPTSGEGEAPTGTTEGVPVEIPSGPVATGDILLADGSLFGQATLTWDGEKLGVEVPDLVPLFGDEQSLVALSDGDIDFETCGADNAYQVGFGDEATMAGLPMPNAKGDPSYFRYLLVMPYWRDGEACVEPIIGLAELTWDVPQTRPWLQPVDGGARDLATGGVLIVGGQPVAYRTAAGDVWGEIATRFGISADDLAYLNPIRAGGFEAEEAYVDEVLNLDPHARGDSETRRPGSELSQSDAFE